MVKRIIAVLVASCSVALAVEPYAPFAYYVSVNPTGTARDIVGKYYILNDQLAWGVPGYPAPTTQQLAAVSSATNLAAAEARWIEETEVIETVRGRDLKTLRDDLRVVKVSVATSIDNCTTNINDMQATTSLSNGFTAAESRALINTLRREVIDANTEMKAIAQELRDVRKAVSQSLKDVRQ